VIGGCVALLSLGALGGTGRAQSAAPQEVVRDFNAVLLKAMQQGPTLGARGRYQLLASAIHQDFDLPAMARLAVGVAWTKLTPQQQQDLTDAFARYTAATYAQNFDSYSGETFDVTGQRKTSFGTIVLSQIVKSDGEPVEIDYLLHDVAGAWRVGDIYLTGTISQVANLRSQFGAILARQGVGGLIATLNSKADMLVASAR